MPLGIVYRSQKFLIMEIHVTRYGSKVSVKDEMFEVSWFDEQQNRQQESHSPLSVKTILLQDGVVVTTAALLLALQHDVDVLVADLHGMPKGRCYGFELHSTPAVQKSQVIVSISHQAVAFVKNWTAQKLENQSAFLERLKNRRDESKGEMLGKGAQEILKKRKEVLALDGKRVSDIADSLRGLEGAAGQTYFKTLSDLLPIEYRFNTRSRMPARDPFNCFLNYGYAVLQADVERALLLAGISPYIGFLHRDDYRQKSMVFDFMEPYRVWIDRVVYRLFSGKKITSKHTEAIEGGLQLNKEGKKLLTEGIREFYEEKKETLDGKTVSRIYFLRQTAVRFARRLLQLAALEKENGTHTA